jgi:hypothetical protein
MSKRQHLIAKKAGALMVLTPPADTLDVIRWAKGEYNRLRVLPGMGGYSELHLSETFKFSQCEQPAIEQKPVKAELIAEQKPTPAKPARKTSPFGV